MTELKTLKDIKCICCGDDTYHDVAGCERKQTKQEAINIIKAIKNSPNGQLELEGFIFTEEHTRLLKFYLNILEEHLK